MFSENFTNKTVEINSCESWTELIYMYGHILPGIALTIFGLTFHPIALYYFSASRNIRRSAYSYYFSAIALVDLLRIILWFGFLVVDYQILKLNFHPYECSIQIFFESVASSISAWLTVSLTVERCLVIFKPLQAFTDRRGKRALIVIVLVILACCAGNSLLLKPGFYEERVYQKESRTIICFYRQPPIDNTTEIESNSLLTSDRKLWYLLFIVVIRVVIPFMLILTANIILFASVRQCTKRSISEHQQVFLVRHGDHRQITPMIFFSSCILLLTISPRYLFQFYINFFVRSEHCSLLHVPHLLKTLELFNYSFNVFISIISGKHGRYELFNMLLCRTKTIQSKFHSPLIQHKGKTSAEAIYQRRSCQKTYHRNSSNFRLSLMETNNRINKSF